MNDERTPQQKLLDQITSWQEAVVEFHGIYCPCPRCEAVRELEKIRREAKQ